MQNKLNEKQDHSYIDDISQYLYEQNSEPRENLSKPVSQIWNENLQGSACLFSQKVSISENLFRSARTESLNLGLQIEQFHRFDDSYKESQSEYDEQKEPYRKRKQPSKNKVYARNYRAKKKQQIKSIEEENRFLKSKIQDLSFRLKQTELQLSRLKHNASLNTKNFQSVRESILRQISKIIQASQNTSIQTLIEVKRKMKSLNAFDNKHKMDLLNYHMSELHQNLINDYGFYFADSLIEKKGFWTVFDGVESRKIDNEIAEFLGVTDFQKLKKTLQQFPQLALNHMKNFKTLWKKLYEDYINIINQGSIIETLCRPLHEKNLRQENRHQLLNYFKLELYFEKIKYRKDMRQFRDSWFHQSSSEEKQAKTNHLKNVCKKIKLAPE